MTILYHLENIEFSYAKKRALHIEQMIIHAETITVLLGHNGSGKSTLLKLLAFLETPQKGRIKFHNEDIFSKKHPMLRKKIVLVDQKPYLLRGTVLENVLQGLKFRHIPATLAERQALDTLEQAGIHRLAHKKATEISGGEAQKVALARALVLQPDVLLLDEPFSHLDEASAEHISQLITCFSRTPNKSIIFSSHNQKHVTKLATQTIQLASGTYKFSQ